MAGSWAAEQWVREAGPRRAMTRVSTIAATGCAQGRAHHRPTAVAALAARRLGLRSMRVDEFDFDLPESAIALEPASPRDHARLLHVNAGAFGDFHVSDLPSLLKAGDFMVVNDTKVIPAQLKGARAGRSGEGAIAIDATLVRRLFADEAQETRWAAFVRPAKRLKAGDVIVFGENFEAHVERRDGAEALLRFAMPGAAFDETLERCGAPPLPPYIARKRRLRPDDVRAYQTVYATEPGSVAAPTAGLHFTPALFDALAARDIEVERVTLHVGAGTFLPVTAEDTAGHLMHSEWGEITPAQAARITAARRAGRRIVAVGTTSLRLLESAAGAGGATMPFRGETDIFITPGYRFRAVDALLTNFHLPRSTLFMLACAFAGAPAMKRAYVHAIARGYRFYSYGDASLLERA